MKKNIKKDPLVGVWKLISFHSIDNEGNISKGPLGDMPEGILIYTNEGYMSVNMMDTEEESGATTYKSYAGQWYRENNEVTHQIMIAPNSAWIGTLQVRIMVLNGDILNLYGNSIIEKNQSKVLEWKKI